MEDKDYTFVELKTDIEWIKKILSNHLAHHGRYAYLLISTVLGLTAALVVVILKG